MNTIEIIVEGGLIQSIDNIPHGVRIVVKDFDVDGRMEEDQRLKISEESGDRYIESVWGGK